MSATLFIFSKPHLCFYKNGGEKRQLDQKWTAKYVYSINNHANKKWIDDYYSKKKCKTETQLFIYPENPYYKTKSSLSNDYNEEFSKYSDT